MPYSAMPSRLMPIDSDGTVVGQSTGTSPSPITSYPSNAAVVGWVNATTATADGGVGAGLGSVYTTLFFPEARTILGITYGPDGGGPSEWTIQGSNDTANGADGTWEAASLPGGLPSPVIGASATAWRTGVKPLTFATSKTALQIKGSTYHNTANSLGGLHVYGVKATGQTPDDIVFLDGDVAFAEYTVDKDFGDRPLGTTVVKQFKIKNTSGTKTANTIVVTCNDADFAISTDGTTYGTTFTITSLGAGVSSPVCFIRNTTPAPGAALGPRQVRLAAAVSSFT